MNLAAPTLAGFFPWLAPTQQLEASAFITEGSNFYWTGGGVRSFPASKLRARLPLPHTCEKPTLFCEDDAVQAISGGVLTDADGVAQYATALRSDAEQLPCKYNWTRACVGCDIVYTHPCYCSFIWSSRCDWRGFTTPATGPIYGSVQLCNRLVLLLEDTVAWSAIDNAWDMEPSLDSGAGFQSLSVGKFGKPLGIHKLSHESALIHTTNGTFVMSASDQLIYNAGNEPQVGAAVFNFTELAYDPPCGSQSIASVNGAPVWMSERGLRQLSEGRTAPYLPEFSAWLLEKQRCQPADLCLFDAPGFNGLAIRCLEETYLYQYDLEKLGHVDQQFDALLTCGKRMYALLGSHLYTLHDGPVTDQNTFVVTSAMRLPKLQLNDKRREFFAEVVELYHADSQCFTSSYMVMHDTLDDTWTPLLRTGESYEYATHDVCSSALYHRLRVSGSFHIAGFSLEGRIGGLQRCP